MPDAFEIIDISQPVTPKSACFPGDTPFQSTVTVSMPAGQTYNLTAFTMSPHVGTHADAPVHIQGALGTENGTIGTAALTPYIGPCHMVDVSPWQDEITLAQVQPFLETLPSFPTRVLFKTARTIRYDVFENEYAYFSVPLISYLAKHGVVLIGIDTPSVDHIHSKPLPAHNALLQANMVWLENLDLTRVNPGAYFLAAQPLKLMTLEASPVRAVLLTNMQL